MGTSLVRRQSFEIISRFCAILSAIGCTLCMAVESLCVAAHTLSVATLAFVCVCMCTCIRVCVYACVRVCSFSLCRSCCIPPSRDVLMILCVWHCVCQWRRWVWLFMPYMWRHLCKYVCMYVCVFSVCVAIAVSNQFVICVFDVIWCVRRCRVCTLHTQSIYVCMCVCVCMYMCALSVCVAVAVSDHVVMCIFDVAWCVRRCRVCTWHTQSMYVCMRVCVCMYVCVVSVCVAVAVSNHVVIYVFDVTWCVKTLQSVYIKYTEYVCMYVCVCMCV